MHLWVTATSDVILYPNFVGASVITDVPRGHDPGRSSIPSTVRFHPSLALASSRSNVCIVLHTCAAVGTSPSPSLRF